MNIPSSRFADAVRLYLRIGLLSFGGPAAQIALMHREFIETRRWLSEHDYLNALGFCMLLPGPEAMQLATYVGWKQHGIKGGLAAGGLFVLPGALLIALLAMSYTLYAEQPLIHAALAGIKAAVLVIVVQALLRMSRRALTTPEHGLIALSAFVAIHFLQVPFPLLILFAALYGALRLSHHASEVKTVVPKRVDPVSTVSVICIGVCLWWLPLAILYVTEADGLLMQLGLFFSKLAVVSFGGAYAVLAYMAQDVVELHGWLSASEMMDALGLAETTPGPLILVTEFVGFIAAARAGGIGFGVLGALLTLWLTFVPCFIWIFAGAPYIEWIGSRPRLKGALLAITAAVVGVILNLSLWFALHVLFDTVTPIELGPLRLWWPDHASLNPELLLLCGAAAVLLLWRRLDVLWVLACSAGLSLLMSLMI